jgi:hypothetical protein
MNVLKFSRPGQWLFQRTTSLARKSDRRRQRRPVELQPGRTLVQSPTIACQGIWIPIQVVEIGGLNFVSVWWHFQAFPASQPPVVRISRWLSVVVVSEPRRVPSKLCFIANSPNCHTIIGSGLMMCCARDDQTDVSITNPHRVCWTMTLDFMFGVKTMMAG